MACPKTQVYYVENMPYLQTLSLHLLNGKEKSPIFHKRLWFSCHWRAHILAAHPTNWVIRNWIWLQNAIFFVRSTCDWQSPTILGRGLMLISLVHKQERSTHKSLPRLQGPENSFSCPNCLDFISLFILLLTIPSLSFSFSQMAQEPHSHPWLETLQKLNLTNSSSSNTSNLPSFGPGTALHGS